jgi:3D (Asp-Asp-Asp) domain-containing protein
LRGEQVKGPALGLIALATLLVAAMAVPRPAVDAQSTAGRLKDAPSPTTPNEEPTGTSVGDLFPDLDFVPALATGYSSTRDETDDTPWTTSTLTRTRPGIIALSRDLLQTFTEDAPFDYGDKILVAGVGIFRVEDTMNARWTHRADIWFPSKAKAKRWGHRKVLLARVDSPGRHPVADESHLDAILASR